MTDIDKQAALDGALGALDAYVHGSGDIVDEAVSNIVGRGPMYLYAAMACWAQVIVKNIRCEPHQRIRCDDCGFPARSTQPNVALSFIDGDTNEVVEPGNMPANAAPAIWCGRFIAATAARDADTMRALFNTLARGAVNSGNEGAMFAAVCTVELLAEAGRSVIAYRVQEGS